MPLEAMEHFNIRATDLEATKEFYCNVLGMTVGERPAFNFPGYWIYLGNTACVHLILADPSDAQKVEGSGAIDHVAFAGTHIRAFVANAKACNVAMTHNKVPDFGIHQIFVHDPDGIKVELNFRGEDAQNYDPET
tara:strand:+ start:230 stop:634 length:405 start_codon:yes stop_codon:yes gene_type:complete